MKVLCIDDKTRPGEYDYPGLIKEGEIYTVIETRIGFGRTDIEVMCHRLIEVPEPVGYNLFNCDRFIPLSTIDETEMIRNYETARI